MEKYKYKDKIYCEEDISEYVNNYGGDLWDLFWDLKKDMLVGEYTQYYVLGSEGGTTYDSEEDLIKAEFNFLMLEE